MHKIKLHGSHPDLKTNSKYLVGCFIRPDQKIGLIIIDKDDNSFEHSINCNCDTQFNRPQIAIADNNILYLTFSNSDGNEIKFLVITIYSVDRIDIKDLTFQLEQKHHCSTPKIAVINGIACIVWHEWYKENGKELHALKMYYNGKQYFIEKFSEKEYRDHNIVAITYGEPKYFAIYYKSAGDFGYIKGFKINDLFFFNIPKIAKPEANGTVSMGDTVIFKNDSKCNPYHAFFFYTSNVGGYMYLDTGEDQIRISDYLEHEIPSKNYNIEPNPRIFVDANEEIFIVFPFEMGKKMAYVKYNKGEFTEDSFPSKFESKSYAAITGFNNQVIVMYEYDRKQLVLKAIDECKTYEIVEDGDNQENNVNTNEGDGNDNTNNISNKKQDKKYNNIIEKYIDLWASKAGRWLEKKLKF